MKKSLILNYFVIISYFLISIINLKEYNLKMDELSELFNIEVDEFCKKAKVNIPSLNLKILTNKNMESINLSIPIQLDWKQLLWDIKFDKWEGYLYFIPITSNFNNNTFLVWRGNIKMVHQNWSKWAWESSFPSQKRIWSLKDLCKLQIIQITSK